MNSLNLLYPLPKKLFEYKCSGAFGAVVAVVAAKPNNVIKAEFSYTTPFDIRSFKLLKPPLNF